MKVEILIRTPGENELIDTVDFSNGHWASLSESVYDLLQKDPNRELIIRQAKAPTEATVSKEWGGEF